MHILNVTYILSKHLEQIQHLLNEFLWKGKNRLNQNLTCLSYEAGGLKMLKVKECCSLESQLDGVLVDR